ncbi:MAG TPA: hypothetical protein VMW77_01335 [Methanoregula sp.]|nr:hypothetical protein [Methanoregula sp.]
MKKDNSPKRISLDDRFRKFWDYGIKACEFITAFSSYREFTPVSDMPYPQGINEFQNTFVSAAKQLGFIEFEGSYNEGNEKFRWALKKDMTDEEKSQLYNKIGEMAIGELGLHQEK